jgi:membrane peptidoglycan carboxypeptidase
MGAVRRRWRWGWVVALAVLALLVWAIIHYGREELATSRHQARFLSRLAGELKFQVEPGPSPDIRFPVAGPYDIRLGYSRIPDFVTRLEQRHYEVTAQARWSPRMWALYDLGIFPIFREQPRSGLDLLDRRGELLHRARFPERVYNRFEDVPQVLVDALLFIENRELLDMSEPTRNPAVEWDRFAKAAFDQLMKRVGDDGGGRAGGGSTLATQIEKYRHSPDGITRTPQDKLRQMASASIRAYMNGEDTRPVRQQLVVDYLNTVPMAARRGYGEVNGIGDGLWAWYGRDFDEVNALMKGLSDGNSGSGAVLRVDLNEAALAFKQALSLIIAQRRPAYYLRQGEAALRELTDSHLRLLAAAGRIPQALRDAALPLSLQLQREAIKPPPVSFVERKAANAMRIELASLLGVQHLYELDRLDLVATTTLDAAVQRNVTRALIAAGTPEGARAAGLYGYRLLSEQNDPSALQISFTLYERAGDANLLRVQADNQDRPFDLNQGARLDLGSTAKLRTLVSYLEAIADCYRRFADLQPDALAEVTIHERDVLARWCRDWLAANPGGSLREILDAAMERHYSASTAEVFYTGGGVHRFANFEKDDTHRIVSVRTAFHESINLPFIRIMRDVVRHTMLTLSEHNARLLTDRSDPQRQDYLARFADLEGRKFLGTFYQRYRGLTPAEARDKLMQRVRPVPRRLATAFRSIAPDAPFEQFAEALRARLPADKVPADGELRKLYERYAREQFSLTDRGYIAGIHPLELWLVEELQREPEATLSELISASADQRQEVYSWLFKTRHKRAQDVRISNLIELEAFRQIHRNWQRLGYPFNEMTPSYAAALGAAGDRPAALAELVGIIVNDGVRMPINRIDTLRLASGTPYETHIDYRAPAGEQVMTPEVADVLKEALFGVVEQGTARRIHNAVVTSDGSTIRIGGKTGTGDRRIDRVGAGGQRISSRVVGRSATFVFIIGDRFFGTLTTYVPEQQAANFRFTSGISVQLLKSLIPHLMPLLENPVPLRAPAQPPLLPAAPPPREPAPEADAIDADLLPAVTPPVTDSDSAEEPDESAPPGFEEALAPEENADDDVTAEPPVAP